jgi:DNA repair protein RecN (Recombination protein N)
LSRVMLALKTMSVDEAEHKTMVFDEVDAGIGGRVADVVGARLGGLGDRFQVLCITHLPQIAAHGDVHFLITKSVRGERTTTSVARLRTEERRQEIARMIAGQEPSAGVVASAAEMLASRTRSGQPVEGAKGETKSKGESERRRAKGRA